MWFCTNYSHTQNRSSHRRCSWKFVVLEKTCSWKFPKFHRKISKILRTTILKNICERLLLSERCQQIAFDIKHSCKFTYMQQNGESYYSQLLLAPTECHETDFIWFNQSQLRSSISRVVLGGIFLDSFFGVEESLAGVLKRVALKIFIDEHLLWSAPQELSCEFRKDFQNSYFAENL